MHGDRLLIKTYQLLSTVGGNLSGYKVEISFRCPLHHLSAYTIVAQSDKLAADKGLRRFISDMAARNSNNGK